jgi:hypothetical protein
VHEHEHGHGHGHKSHHAKKEVLPYIYLLLETNQGSEAGWEWLPFDMKS